MEFKIFELSEITQEMTHMLFLPLAHNKDLRLEILP